MRKLSNIMLRLSPIMNLCRLIISVHFKANQWKMVQKNQNAAKDGNEVSKNGSAICELLSEITKKNYKKIRVNIEIVNDSD